MMILRDFPSGPRRILSSNGRGGGLALASDRLADGRQSRVDVAAQIDAIKTNDR